MAEETADVYRKDVTFGFDKHLRGHWSDRLPAIEQDIAKPAPPFPVEFRLAQELIAELLKQMQSRYLAHMPFGITKVVHQVTGRRL